MTANSKDDRRMLGLSLHGWENSMVVFLIIAGFFALLAGAATWAVVRLQRIELAETQKQLDSYKLSVEAKVADAKKEGIEAGKMAGNALVRAEELRAANLALESQIAPRRISEAQIRSIGLALSRFAGKAVSVVTYSLDSEAAVLAQQIMAALRLANIQVQDRIASVMPMGGFALGIHISGPDAALVSAMGGELQIKGGLIVAPPNSPTGGGASIGTGPPVGTKDPDASILVGAKPITR
jgi:hypothetical protein